MNPPLALPLFLASRSPRRRALLAEAGVPVIVRESLDDGLLMRGPVTPTAWAMALAFAKARWLCDELQREREVGTVLAADTICVVDGRVLGQPVDRAAARAMLDAFRSRDHEVISGVCLIDVVTGDRQLFADSATVRWGHVDSAAMEQYLDGGAWQGKAGGYNLAERIAAGWAITCIGDPSTVMGLPLRRLASWLPTEGASP